MSFHICNVICSIIALFIYISFRFGVDSYLRVNKNSKTYIRKSKKGYLNYWTYKKINEDIGLGNIFHLNVFLFMALLSRVFAHVEDRKQRGDPFFFARFKEGKFACGIFGKNIVDTPPLQRRAFKDLCPSLAPSLLGVLFIVADSEII